MIVLAGYIVGVPALETKRDTELAINTNTVLPGPIPLKALKSIPRRPAQDELATARDAVATLAKEAAI